MPQSTCKRISYLFTLLAVLLTALPARGFTGAIAAVLQQEETKEQAAELEEKAAEIEERAAELEEKAAEAEEKIRVEIGGGTIIVEGETLSVGDAGERGLTIIKKRSEEEEEGVSIKRGDIVKFGENIKVEEGEKVRGSVVSIGGEVVVKGIVTEDAVAIGGDVFVSTGAEVGGSAVSVGGKVTREPGGKIGEEEVSVGPGWLPPLAIFGRHGDEETNHVPFVISAFIRFILRLFLIGLVIAMGMAVVLFFPRHLAVIEERVALSPWKMGLAGFLAEILIVPVLVIVAVVLAITLIGIPLLILVIPLYLLAVVAACFFGYIGVASIAAKFVESRTGVTVESPYARIALGILLLMLAGLLAWILGLGNGPLHFAAVLFSILSWMIFYIAVTVGLGAVITSKFGTAGISTRTAFPGGTKVTPGAIAPEPPPAPSPGR